MSLHKFQHDIVHASDRDGRSVVGVKLSIPSWMENPPQELRAWVYAEDYELIVAAYGQRAWVLNRGRTTSKPFVRIKKLGPLPTTLARFVTGNRRSTFVHYADGNHCNLRRTNLYTQRGHGGRKKVNRNRWAAGDRAKSDLATAHAA